MPYADKDRQRQYQREWVAKRRDDYFADKRCARCQSSESLELHHEDSSEKVSHRVWSWSEERRVEELAKCVVWCRDCHLEHHAEERFVPHGARGYRRGCRCEVCRGYKREEKRKYLERKRSR